MIIKARLYQRTFDKNRGLKCIYKVDTYLKALRSHLSEEVWLRQKMEYFELKAEIYLQRKELIYAHEVILKMLDNI